MNTRTRVGLLAVVCCAGPAAGQLCDAGALSRSPYIQSLTTDSVIIAWRLKSPGAAELRYGAQRGRLDRRRPATLDSQTGIHWVRLSGLRSGARYHYSVFAGERPLTGGDWFQTAPGPGDPAFRKFRFAVVGDQGFNRFKDGKWIDDGRFEPDPQVNTQLAVARLIERHSPDLLLTTGDNIYDVGKEINYDPQMFCPYQKLLRNIPFYPSLGNHDYYGGTNTTEPLPVEDRNAAPFYRNLFLPEHGTAGGDGPSGNPPDPAEAYYSFEYGDVQFVALNTVRPNYVDYRAGSPQLRWLDETLGRSPRRWKIVYFHYPVYSSTRTAPASLPVRLAEMKDHVEPVLLKHRVDLVLNGHTHSYQRSRPVARGKVDEQNGIVYVVTGGGGKSADRIVPAPEPWNALTREGYHFLLVAVEGDDITVEAIFLDGARDKFTISKRRP